MDDQQQLLDTVVNAFGNQHFDPEKVISALLPDYVPGETKVEGSILALVNSLTDITDLAKKLY